MHSCNQSLPFVPTKCTQYVKYRYVSPITSYMFRCLLHPLQEDHYVSCSKTIFFLQCCYIDCAIKSAIYPVCLIYNAVTMLKTIFISSFCILKTLQMFVKIHNCSILISVGSYSLLCMLAIYVFTVSSGLERTPFLLLCCSFTTGTGSSQDLYIITDPNTVYVFNILCTFSSSSSSSSSSCGATALSGTGPPHSRGF